MEQFFLLLKCNAVDELIFLFELIDGVEYKTINHKGVEAYKIDISHVKSKMMVEAIKDLNVYIPKVNVYLSDIILLPKIPTKEILDYINLFSSDDLFLPYISNQRMKKIGDSIIKPK